MSIKSISTEASNKIWNQSGKHTHSELDEIIKSVLSSQLAEVIKMAEEILKNKNKEGKFIREEDPASMGRFLHERDGCIRALSDLIDKLKNK